MWATMQTSQRPTMCASKRFHEHVMSLVELMDPVGFFQPLIAYIYIYTYIGTYVYIYIYIYNIYIYIYM